jgi:hypothetical protein
MQKIKLIILIVGCLTFLNGFGQSDKLKKVENVINEKLKKYSNEGTNDNYWQIKILDNGNMEQYYVSQKLSYNFNDIDSIKYMLVDEKHIVRICCRGDSNCIKNFVGEESEDYDYWDYMSFNIISKAEAEDLIKELNNLKLIIPKKTKE